MLNYLGTLFNQASLTLGFLKRISPSFKTITRMDCIAATNKPQIFSLQLPIKMQNLQRSTYNSTTIKLLKQQSRSNPEPTGLEHTKQTHAYIIKTHLHHSHLDFSDPLCPVPSLAAQFNSLVSSYINNNKPEVALTIYSHMRKTDVHLDNFTIPSVLKACARLSRIQMGREIHGLMLKIGYDWDIFVHNSLIHMYSASGMTESARNVFDKMPERDTVSWSTMIGCYGQRRDFIAALDLIREMQINQVKPSEITMINMVNLFADYGVLEMGKQLHAYVIKHGNSISLSVPVNTALIDMYAKCGSIKPAQCLFDEMPQRSVVSWTAMIAGYIRCENLGEGMKLFQEMQDENVFPNTITMVSLVLECGNREALEVGQWLHAFIVKNCFKMSVVLATALLDMYGKCAAIENARILFDRMHERDIMSWTAMISAYAKAKCLDRAFDLFLHMQNANVKPNEVTMVNLLSLCANFGALDLGKWVHTCMDKQGIEADVVLATALVDMYAKCGDVEGAYQVFNRTHNRDICMWNAMMGGLAMHGNGRGAVELFAQMEDAGIKPNDITFIGLLHACGHAGLVAEGHQFFNRMVHEFKMIPKVEHYGCMVDLLGRAGWLDEAYNMIHDMPIKPNTIIWGALLAACKLHKNPRLGELAARELLELQPDNCGYQVLLSNIYAAANRWDDVAELRKIMKERGIKKGPGFSSIEVNGLIYKFVMGDESHPKTKEIHKMLAEMGTELKQMGYVANTSAVLLNIGEEEKETSLSYHSEKLAIAFGLISTAPHTPIRVVKNLRVCEDCHSATKLISKIYSRVIIVRDRKRFHHFSEGSCSCGDFW